MSAPVHVVLLAAGESTRMGELKALLPWAGGQPLIAYQAAQVLASPLERVVVVLGHRADEVGAHLPGDERLRTTLNPEYRSGKAGSIVAGVRATGEDAHVLVLGVDQPRPAELITQVVAQHRRGGSAITVAGYGGRRGHPVLFAPELRDELLAIDEATQGLRAVLQRHAGDVAVVETGSPLTLVNLNTPEDYRQALHLAGRCGDADAAARPARPNAT
jgi:molybdenum cofactor cytidylyltransferase